MGWFWSDAQPDAAAEQQQQQQQQYQQLPQDHLATDGDISKCPVMHTANSDASPLNNPNSPFYAGPQSQSQSQQQPPSPPPGQPASAWSKLMGYVNASPAPSPQPGAQAGADPSKCPVTHASDSPHSPLNNPNSPFYIAPKHTIPSHREHDEPATAAIAPPEPPTEEEPSSSTSWTATLNPLNYMPTLSNTPPPTQTHDLSTARTASSIPRAATPTVEVWEYPSAQQMFNAVVRKGHAATDPAGIPAMVAVHNWLNEGTWAQVERWDGVFRGRSLAQAWRLCRRGEEAVDRQLEWEEERRRGEAAAMVRGGGGVEEAAAAVVGGGPRLARFQGRPGDLTPRARMLGLLGYLFPQKFSDNPPFDRHDWYVERQTLRGPITMRYVIDFYALPPEPNGMPAFNVDVRPALDSPRAAAERFIVWAGDVWWRASGGRAREGGDE